MLRNQEKNSVVRGIFLIGGWGLGLDRFYEGDKKGGFLSTIGRIAQKIDFEKKEFISTFDTTIFGLTTIPILGWFKPVSYTHLTLPTKA